MKGTTNIQELSPEGQYMQIYDENPCRKSNGLGSTGKIGTLALVRFIYHGTVVYPCLCVNLIDRRRSRRNTAGAGLPLVRYTIQSQLRQDVSMHRRVLCIIKRNSLDIYKYRVYIECYMILCEYTSYTYQTQQDM